MSKAEESELNPYKEMEFEAFLEVIDKDRISSWKSLAEALGVTQDTIIRWKKHPEARKALNEGIHRCLKEMERSGKHDWRMWRERAELYGLKKVDNVDLTSGGEKLEGLVIYKPSKNE